MPPRGCAACGRPRCAGRTPPSDRTRACTSRCRSRPPARRSRRRSPRSRPRAGRRRCSTGWRASSRRSRSAVSAAGTSGKTRHEGSDAARACDSAPRHRETEVVGDPRHRLGHHLAIRDAAAFLHVGLDAHVRLEQQLAVGVRPEVEHRLAHAAGPVDEGAVAVEGGPPFAHAGQCTQAAHRRRTVRPARGRGRRASAAGCPASTGSRSTLAGPGATPRDRPTAPRARAANGARRRRRTARRRRDPSSRPRSAGPRAHRASRDSR